MFHSTVGDAPEIVTDLEDTTVIAPDNAVLECEITPGNPKAILHWYKDAKEIYKSKKFVMEYENNIAKLTINNPEPSDIGVYRCEAVNKIGRVETEGALKILCKYRII